jgi:hypothetical protein
VQIVFPDGTAIEVAEDSEVECVSPTRVRLLAGTMDHVQRAVAPSQSAQHLPPELDIYGGTFDQNGSWQYDAPYGYVWYPTVAADWRPYYHGYWSPVPRYGYTWIGIDLWAWPTHHYGRWGFARNRWFWIPGRTWGPAWVSWASAPGYVGWSPLGFDGRPVFSFAYGYGRSWAGWSILPRSHFGSHRYYAHRNGVDPRRIPANAAFVARNGPPAAPARVGRPNVNGAPAVGVAVPRYPTSTSPATRQSPVGTPQSPPVGTPLPSQAGTLRSSPVGAQRSSPVGTPQMSPVGRPQSSPVGTPRSSPVGTPQMSPLGTPQSSPVATPRGPSLNGSPTIVRPGPAADGQATIRERRPLPQTRYGMPRPTAPAAAPAPPPPASRPVMTPESRPAPVYQQAPPGSRSPGEYRIQQVQPRAPSAERAPSPMAAPRIAPMPSPAAPPLHAAPAQSAPPHARPAPANAQPQGEGRPRSGGRGRSR